MTPLVPVPTQNVRTAALSGACAAHFSELGWA